MSAARLEMEQRMREVEKMADNRTVIELCGEIARAADLAFRKLDLLNARRKQKRERSMRRRAP